MSSDVGRIIYEFYAASRKRADKSALIIFSNIATIGVHLGHKSIALWVRTCHVDAPEICKNTGLVRLQLVGIEFTTQGRMNAIQRTARG
ncbi:hypothetical protein DEO45_00200 [Rhodanobacter denitrificans]|uniref:Uncharacterized protein n=1 Tax=Rhodanobacter denitrificans TaxID=666685 RepID=A0A368KKA1_9GAMM|nr:hypothetical protein DEO45_00200 [Rhodanobacter denitrificans]